MKKILFIGNSYTYYNDMPMSIFAPLAQSDGETVLVTSVTRGGARLVQHADPDTELGQKLRSAIRGQRFDWVILQEQSLAPIAAPDTFRNGVSLLKAMLEPHTEHFLLYATWGRKPGAQFLTESGLTTEEMTRLLAEAYDKMGAEHGMPVAHVGKAFLRYRQEHPDAEVYHEDGTHPSPLGSRIAAETLWNAIQAAEV